WVPDATFGRRVFPDPPSAWSWVAAGRAAGKCARERRHDPGPGAAPRVDQVVMTGPGYLAQRARGKSAAHFRRHLIIGGAVEQGHGYRRRGARSRVGDGVAFRDLLRPSAQQAADRA